ncbi:MAG: UDP-glucose 4-epimerase GalE [Verrucomicrobiales bacterium]|jgi:UDP-glucose 4-epimerase|nr:UDP-glucose 4-epimerase GalE [Verrucomicrobiales bacterium]
MRIFVTGGAGYIGSVCVEELLKCGHEVLVFDNMEEGHQRAVVSPATLTVGDINNFEQVNAAVSGFKPEAVIHFAGKALVGESMTNPYVYYQTNVMGGTNLLEAAVRVGCKKFVFSSSCATYGLPEKMPMDERIPQRPINPYGHSKLIFEQVLKWYEQVHGVTFTALRYFNAAGASKVNGEDRKIETHLIPNVLDVALGKKDHMSIFGNEYNTPDGTCIRDYVHVIDLADAHIKALDRASSGFYNLGSGDGYSVLQVIETARKITGHAIPAKMMPPRPGDPPRLVASANKVKMDMGWKPRFNKLSTIIETAWEWRKAHPNGYNS